MQDDSDRQQALEQQAEQFEAALEKQYECLAAADKAALEAESDITEENELIERTVERIWQAKRLPDNISDIEAEQKFIEIMRLKYRYPDYADLVGPPSVDDFKVRHTRRTSSAMARLSWERKTDLLLLGEFSWKGMYIAKAQAYTTDDPKGWLVGIEPGYRPADFLGAHYFDHFEGWSKRIPRYCHEVRFIPFAGSTAQWLHDVLVECDSELGYRPARGKYKRVRFKDDNPYNCLPDNLMLVENRGRRMRCQSCGEETTPQASTVVRDGRHKLRYCHDCLLE